MNQANTKQSNLKIISLQTMARIFFVFFISLITLTSHAQEFLSPEKAFLVTGELSQEELIVRMEPAKGYYLYKEPIQFKLKDSATAIQLSANQYPPTKKKFDENFGKVVETYGGSIEFAFNVNQLNASVPLQLEVTLQGCAEKGICYPPMTRYLTVSQYGAVTPSTSSELGWGNTLTSPQMAAEKNLLTDWWEARDDLNALGRLLQSASLPVLLLGFFLLGLGLSFTPCMLPMLPILSSIVFGTTDHHLLSRKRTLLLASLYIAGMAFAFSLAGMATAWFGSGIQAGLQSPWIVITFGLLMIVLAGSLLGFYEFHLPQFWHGVVDRWMGKQKGGSLVGAFVLGALSSLVASPCVTAPLAGVLTFIAQSGEVQLGGLILFTLACGMGVPLMLFALGASRFVPRAGAWMVRVQRFFGILMLALALWVMGPALSTIFTSHQEQASAVKDIAGMEFKVVRTSQDLDLALQKAKSENKKVFLNFYADWCVSCKELERLTFKDATIQSKLQGYERIEVDITKAGEDQNKILKQYKLFGPPGLLIIDERGQEKMAARSVGYISAEKLAPKL
jgi:thiol:disulfide interchange protein DsbD